MLSSIPRCLAIRRQGLSRPPGNRASILHIGHCTAILNRLRGSSILLEPACPLIPGVVDLAGARLYKQGMHPDTIAIIGGTGLSRLQGLELLRRETLQTPYGEPSAAPTIGMLHGREVVFLARHGDRHTIPPHRVNYRANLWALKHLGIGRVISLCAVGGIAKDIAPGVIVIPDQIIDYTWSRAHTLFEDDLDMVTHIDFTTPYCEELRQALLAAAARAGIAVLDKGTYCATQGPRLETAAEIDRKEKDGCDMVGMTGMPEAALARELGLCYAACAVSANTAAGRGSGPITMKAIEATLASGMERVQRILEQVIRGVD